MKAVEKLEVNMKGKSTDTKVALIEQSVLHINQSLERMEKRFDSLDSKFNRIEEKIDSSNRWLLTLGVSVIFSCAALAFNIYQVIQH